MCVCFYIPDKFVKLLLAVRKDDDIIHIAVVVLYPLDLFDPVVEA